MRSNHVTGALWRTGAERGPTMIQETRTVSRRLLRRIMPLLAVALIGAGAAACSSSGASGNPPATTHSGSSNGSGSSSGSGTSGSGGYGY